MQLKSCKQHPEDVIIVIASQKTSSWVSKEQSAAEAPQAGAAGASQARVQSVRGGQVADWAALERVLYDILYTKVHPAHLTPHSHQSSLAPGQPLQPALCGPAQLPPNTSPLPTHRDPATQLGWELGSEGTLLIAEPIGTPRVRAIIPRSSQAVRAAPLRHPLLLQPTGT